MSCRLVRRVTATIVAFMALAGAVSVHASSETRVGVHRYRISAKVRLLLFWAGRDNVGSARASWLVSGDGGQELTLLIGSDPERAPRGVNEWGFVREQVDGDSARVFGVRTVGDADSPDAARALVDERDRTVTFDAICSQVDSQQVLTTMATVTGQASLDHARFEPLLDALNAHSSWSLRRMKRPAGTAPGFLTALHGMMTRLAASWRGGGKPGNAHAYYVYKDSTYDLSVERIDALPEFRTGNRRILKLLRVGFLVRNTQSESLTRFEAIFGTEGDLAGVPVQATYQPTWWFKIRLELDESADAPSSSDEVRRRRVDDTCARAMAAARRIAIPTANGGRP